MSKLPCPPELWPEFSALLDEALDLPSSEQVAWLSALGVEHDAVRPWLKRVIGGDGATVEPDFLQVSPSDDTHSEFNEGQHIGSYVLKSKLGSGGMGEVWVASRGDGTLKRQVALKLPHSHLLVGVQRRRFERERDILAALTHPNIAQLYDAGVADSKHPYLAMECVDGKAINDHCCDSKLSLPKRLQLFLQVLDAVGYAHARFIAHRDLKPSNILVTRDERVKLLDFGIAKLLGGDTDAEATQLTRVGATMATPGYAAPEQLAGQPITVAVDLYALGVVLHELLTGTRPQRDAWRGAGQKGAGHSDAARASTRIAAEHPATVGNVDYRTLRRELSGDLDAIIAKALETNPAQRYSSAEAFALDIRNSLEHRPITARRLSAARLSLRFVRRHAVGVAMGACLLLVLIGGAAGIAWQAVRAEREAQRATTIKDFLIGVFRASDPRIAADKPRGEITARELLDASSGQIEHSFANQPETQVELLGVTADIYHELDETKRSAELYQRETELATRYLGKEDAHAIEGMLGQAENADADGEDTRTLELLARADPLIQRAGHNNSPIRASWLMIRGEALMNDSDSADQAQSAMESAVAIYQRSSPGDRHFPELLIDLGDLLLARSRFTESASYYSQAIEATKISVQAKGQELLAYAGLALALKRLGNFEGAAAAFRDGTSIAAQTYGQNSWRYWLINSDWARFRYERGDREAALSQFEKLTKSLPASRAAYQNAYAAMQSARVLLKYGHCMVYDGQADRGIELLLHANNLLGLSAPDPQDEAALALELGRAYGLAGRPKDAAQSFVKVFQTLQRRSASQSELSVARESFGRWFLTQNDIQKADAEFHEAVELSKGRQLPSAILAQADLAEIALIRGDVQSALKASADAMEGLENIEGNYDVRIKPQVWRVRAQSLLAAGQYVQARSLASQARDSAALYFAPGSEEVVKSSATLQETTTLLHFTSF